MLLSVYVAWKILPRFPPVIASKTVRSALGLISGISGLSWLFIFVYFILPRCDFTLEQLRVAVYWAMVPVLVLLTISFLVFDKSERQQLTTTRS
jgi:signal transduction histidine kinase